MARQPARWTAVLAAAVTLVAIAVPAAPQSGLPDEPPELTRPIPGPVVPPDFYRAAVQSGTRTETGRPGPEYWQIRSEYEIDAKLDPRAALLSGSETIRFLNRSPDEIAQLQLHLHQNLHASGAVRNRPAEVTGGVTLERLAVNGEELFRATSPEEVGYQEWGAILRVRPPEPVPAGGEAELRVDWSFEVPQNSSGRMGHSDREVYFIAYWFPKVGVYDDLRGWDAEPYLGGAEFYDSFADYRVSLTVPADWTVDATGTLDNPEEVYSEQTLQRLATAAESNDVVRIATVEDRQEGRVTVEDPSGNLTYRFTADDVRDFTWTASNVQVWDATSAAVADRDGDGAEDRVAIHSFFRPDRAPLWEEQARYAKHSIEFLSRETGLTYPWPHMTSVEGADIIGGGMEFPMMTVIGSYREREARDLYGVTLHELAHMWTPMILGSNEKRHAWMDEGFASYLTARGVPEFWPDLEEDPELGERQEYLETARSGLEGVMMQHGDYYETGYGTASYAKPATLLVTLRNLLGPDLFREAVTTYMQEWKFKHPAPWDFFRTFERVAGQDLDWFWSSWYFETWSLDHAVAGVGSGPDGPVVTIRDEGFVPMPAPVRIETSAGGTLERTVPVRHWLDGATSYEIALPASVGEVLGVEIDPESLYPDIDRADNVWPEPEEPAEEAQEEQGGQP